jgi:uncharacterized protein YndB with AHSA1/START domain
MGGDIHHTFVIAAAPGAVADALMQEEAIRQWWTTEAGVRDGVGVMGWSGYGWEVELAMSYDPPVPEVTWRCTRSNMQNTSAWEGTTIRFALVPHGTGTRVEFSQTGYRESPCRDICNQGWAFFVGTSLKQYLETGRGIPYPEMLDTSKA